MKKFKLYVENKEKAIEFYLTLLDKNLNEFRNSVVKNKFNKRMKERTYYKRIVDKSNLIRRIFGLLNNELSSLFINTKITKEEIGEDNYYVPYAEEYISQVIYKRDMYKKVFDTYASLIEEAEKYFDNKNEMMKGEI